MYCERCGKQIDKGLNFCNGCGAQLKKDGEKDQSALVTLIGALIAVGVGGFAILIPIFAILLDKIDRYEPVFAFAALYLLLQFGICFMIARQISRLIDAKVGSGDTVETVKYSPAQLSRRSTNQLEEFREPASVIENTTRTLDRFPRD